MASGVGNVGSARDAQAEGIRKETLLYTILNMEGFDKEATRIQIGVKSVVDWCTRRNPSKPRVGDSLESASDFPFTRNNRNRAPSTGGKPVPFL